MDAELVLHTTIEYKNYDKAVVVTGDGDFHCLLEYLKKHDKLKRLIIPNRYKYSSLLRKFGLDMIFMNDLRTKLEYKEHKKREALPKDGTFRITSHRDSLQKYHFLTFLSSGNEIFILLLNFQFGSLKRGYSKK